MLEQIEKGHIPMRKTFKVKLKQDSSPLYFSSMFDSGNMQKVEIGPNSSVIITPAHDCSGSSYQSHAKGWFYFSIRGGQNHQKIKLIIKKLSQLSSQMKVSQYFKPVYRYQKQQWLRLQSSRTITKQQDTELHIQFQFTKSSTIYFAYTYPFSYEQCEKYLQRIKVDVKKMKSIYYHDQILIKSPEGRNIHLLTLSSNQQITDQQQNVQNTYLFPQQGKRPLKFNQQKKVVIVSARVHPAQAPSSHTFNGFIQFITSKDARAYYLRKHFVFKMIPMLNPDGVSNGHYRMDIFNQNLNRFYQNPDPLIQPSAYAVKQIGKYYFKENKLCFYIDLHAHPQKKGNFIYGNAMDSNQLQAETQLFPKILSLNSIQFDYNNSSFDSKHMTLKDKNQDLTKQGCGRVVFQKQFNLSYSYTMQCGYTCSNYLNQIVSIQKAHRKFQKHSIIVDEIQNIKSPYYGGGKKCVYFTIKAYQMLGKNIAISILDLFDLNPASRIPNTTYQTLDNIRKEITSNLIGGNSSYFVRKFVGKPISQQSIKSGKNENKASKTINSFTSISQKNKIQSVSLDKKTILVSSQFIFLQNKNMNQKINEKIKSDNIINQKNNIGNEKKQKNSTLPKVNLFKLNALQKNVKLMTNI